MAVFSEDDLLPISALQHLAFCERQWGLIYLEGIWGENRLTVEGRHLHERVDEYAVEKRGAVRIVRSLRLRSLRLGLTGIADVVEFHRLDDADAKEGIPISGSSGYWRSFPVEYKRGRPKPDHCDAVQLCAQALCLEEMLKVGVPRGAVYYGKPRRRQDFEFDDALRRETEALAARLHVLYQAGKTPIAQYEKKCNSCSLYESCMPKTIGAMRSVSRYLRKALSLEANE